MSERKYYCFCDSNCKFETMTKEQILAAIAQAAEGGLVFDVDAGFISKVKESNAGGYITFWVGTQAQYNALAKKDANCFYLITDSTAHADIERAISEAMGAAAEAAGVAAEALAEATSGIRAIASSLNGGGYKYMYSEEELDEWLEEQLDELMHKSPAMKVSGFYAENVFKTQQFVTVTLQVGMQKSGAIAVFESHVNGCTMRWKKNRNGGSWNPLEWENPLLENGVEYRTTERFGNAPVYVFRYQRQLSGTANSAAVVSVDALAGVSVVDFNVVLKHSSGSVFKCPAFTTSGTLAANADVYVDSTTADITITPKTSECANCTAEIVIKYTK